MDSDLRRLQVGGKKGKGRKEVDEGEFKTAEALKILRSRPIGRTIYAPRPRLCLMGIGEGRILRKHFRALLASSPTFRGQSTRKWQVHTQLQRLQSLIMSQAQVITNSGHDDMIVRTSKYSKLPRAPNPEADESYDSMMLYWTIMDDDWLPVPQTRR